MFDYRLVPNVANVDTLRDPKLSVSQIEVLRHFFIWGLRYSKAI